MNQPIAKWLIEAVCAVFFAIAVIFTFRLYTSQSANPGTVNRYAREGTAVSEVTDEMHQEEIDKILEKGNTVSGSSIYYDLTAGDSPESVTIDGEDAGDAIEKAKEGDSEDLMGMIDRSATYYKTYTYESSGDGSSVLKAVTYEKR